MVPFSAFHRSQESHLWQNPCVHSAPGRARQNQHVFLLFFFAVYGVARTEARRTARAVAWLGQWPGPWLGPTITGARWGRGGPGGAKSAEPSRAVRRMAGAEASLPGGAKQAIESNRSSGFPPVPSPPLTPLLAPFTTARAACGTGPERGRASAAPRPRPRETESAGDAGSDVAALLRLLVRSRSKQPPAREQAWRGGGGPGGALGMACWGFGGTRNRER